jgi:hypothetical protein
MSIARGVRKHSWIPFVLTFAACSMGRAPKAYVAGEPGSAPVASYSPSSGHAAMGGGGEVYEPVPDRPGLGTQWGEQVSAPISFRSFMRASSSPWAQVLLHYNDAEGVRAHSEYLGTAPQPLEVFAGDGSLSVALVDEGGRTLPGYSAGGRTLVIGEDGERYRIIVHNSTPVRFEVVASVDGLDVIDGKPADPNRRGYLVDPHDDLVIDGFRTSDNEVAAFRFGKVADSYAARTSGDRNVGVVGLAIFAERGAVWSPNELQRRDSADPFPNRGYAAPPRD